MKTDGAYSGGPAGPAGQSRRLIEDLLRAAVAAPSMHNTQPWRFRNAGGRIELRADQARMLPVADPRGRAAHIACGAALFNLRMAATAAGLQAAVRLLPDPAQPLLLAETVLTADHTATEWEQDLYAAVFRRQANREPFSRCAVPPGIQAELAAAADAEGASLHLLDRDEATRVLSLAAAAETDLLGDPAYRAELTRWAGGQRDRDGIPGDALGPRSPEGHTPVRDFTPDQHRQPGCYAWFEEHPQLAVLSAHGDTPRDWLTAGQALQRVWLTATCRGISACPLTQPLETPDAWLVRDWRSGSEQPQMILRIGYGLPLAHRMPRRPVTAVLDETQPAAR